MLNSTYRNRESGVNLATKKCNSEMPHSFQESFYCLQRSVTGTEKLMSVDIAGIEVKKWCSTN